MWHCPNGDKPETFVAMFDLPGSNTYAPSTSEIGIQVYLDGRSTNRWGDGVAGVALYLQGMAEDAEVVVCPHCNQLAEWI